VVCREHGALSVCGTFLCLQFTLLIAANGSPALSDIKPRYTESANSPVPFFHLLERLKTTPRAGWRRFGLEPCESISDHMYRMSIMTMMAPSSISSKLDLLKCCRMALIHDMAEALVGDITPVDGVSKEDKSRRESETMDYICTTLLGKFNGGLNGQEIRKLWQEYEDSETIESKFVHDIDKVELISQMVEYERAQQGKKDLGEFTWVATKVQSDEVKAWVDQLFWERLQMWKEFGTEPQWSEGTKPQSKPAPI
jgi:putative hydrolase of HD superfamily